MAFSSRVPSSGTSEAFRGVAPGRANGLCHVTDDLIARWPGDLPVSAVAFELGAGWSFIAAPAGVFRCGRNPRPTSEWVGTGEAAPVPLMGDPLVDLDRLLAWGSHVERSNRRGRLTGGWIISLSYGLGREIEPRAQAGVVRPDDDWPLIEMHYCPAGYLVDGSTGEAAWIGDESRRPRLTDLPPRSAGVGPLTDHVHNKRQYIEGVERIIEYIRAGDIFQANLAHRLSTRFRGSTRRAFLGMRGAAQPWYSAYMELAERGAQERRAILSLSPELFLEMQPRPQGGMEIRTRPMKGTRPAPPIGDGEELRGNPKDRAELNMIIDLMRNDIGRICLPGSVRVLEARSIERHGGERGVLQATATIAGVVGEGQSMGAVLRATFPPGSVTGAPKIRAMQIIDELEPVARGPYCGAMGWIGFDGHVVLNVAIRTALVRGRAGAARDEVEEGALSYSVGAGIVADSEPESEWRETLDKAGILNHGVPRRGTEGGEDVAKWQSGKVTK
jgi:para-aminobenzoate synthetase component I